MRALTLVALLALSGCASYNPMNWIAPHRMEIRQGNQVTEDVVARLKTGMTRQQVRFLLGTPLVDDIFHAGRWDYIYQQYVEGRKTEQRQLTLYFKDDKLERIEGNALPADNAPPPLEASAPVGAPL